MGKLGRKTEKEPIHDKATLARLDNIATSMQGGKDGEIILILRYTGAHPSALIDPKYQFGETVSRKGKAIIQWLRPKKAGKEAYTTIPKSSKLAGTDINRFINGFQKRKRRASRQYIYALCRRVGEEAGIAGLSPMTLRHTACVDMLERGLPDATVRQVMNVSVRTFRTYSKYTADGVIDAFEKAGW